MRLHHAFFGVFSAVMLTSCPIGGLPSEQLGARFTLQVCGTSRVDFETPTACRVLVAANATDLPAKNTEYTILLPEEFAMKAYFAANGMTEAQFIASQTLASFTRKHLLVGSAAVGGTLADFDGATRVVTGAAPDIQISGKPARIFAQVGEVTFVSIGSTF